jgi:hypothetical protein
MTDSKTLQLNKKYYGHQLDKYRKVNLMLEWLILAGASGSGIAGIAVLQTDYGKVAWGVLSAISVILALAKPLLRFTDRITGYAKLYGEYATGTEKLRQLVDDIQADHLLSAARIKTFEDVRKRVGELSALGDAVPRLALVRKLQMEVNEQININRLWLPSDGQSLENITARVVR